MNNSVWFVVVCFHPENTLINRLIKVFHTKQFIVVDNGNDHRIEHFVKNSKGQYRAPQKNLGYGGGANIGIEYARQQGAQWIVVLNQDVQMTKEALRECINQLTKLAPCIAGPEIGTLDQLRWTTIFLTTPGVNGQLQYISGSCLAIHKQVIEKVGGFYEPYFMYYEDVDFCIRAKNAGFSLQKINIPDFRHEESISIVKGSYLHEYYLARNHMLFVERHAPFFVRFRELLRLPKTYQEHKKFNNVGASDGINDYLFRNFGKHQSQQSHAIA